MAVPVGPAPPCPPVRALPRGVTRHEPPIGTRPLEVGPSELALQVRDAAIGLGFARVGFTPVEHFDRAGRALERWLQQGYHGEMAYLASAVGRDDPRRLLAEARTLIVVALPYPRPTELAVLGGGSKLTGQVAAYAQGADYHSVIKPKLRSLADECARLTGRSVLARACVDTAPLLEREAAVRGGLGFAAKSTMLIIPGLGTQVLLGELLLDLEISALPDPAPRSGCGSCSACLDACPTQAFVAAYMLDARRCVSYLTIELSGTIPRELRALIGTRVFGCDICQAVCPFNASASPKPVAPELAPRDRLRELDLISLLELTSSGYRRLVQGSALRRVSRAQLARNAAVALGNSADPRAVAPLIRALERDRRPLVRLHAAWALGRLRGLLALQALARAVLEDSDAAVRDEAELCLSELSARDPSGT